MWQPALSPGRQHSGSARKGLHRRPVFQRKTPPVAGKSSAFPWARGLWEPFLRIFLSRSIWPPVHARECVRSGGQLARRVRVNGSTTDPNRYPDRQSISKPENPHAGAGSVRRIPPLVMAKGAACVVLLLRTLFSSQPGVSAPSKLTVAHPVGRASRCRDGCSVSRVLTPNCPMISRSFSLKDGPNGNDCLLGTRV
jgi:hypothetical protein